MAIAAIGLTDTPSAAAAVARYEGTSANGGEVFFTTTDQLVPADTDSQRDIYMRSFDPSVGETGEYVTREISIALAGGNDSYPATFYGVSADGSKVFFTTAEPLVPADTDRSQDVYMREPQTGKTTLISVGQGACVGGCGNLSPASFAGMTADGNEVFFATAERLVEGDKDNVVDVYERNLTAGETILASAGVVACEPGCGNEEIAATLVGVASGGTKAFFATTEQLSSFDEDEQLDVYARDLPNGPTELISQGASACQPQCGNGNEPEQAPIFTGSSSNGAKAFFESSEELVPGDGDGVKDIYLREGNETFLISAGPEPTPASVAHEATGLHPAISEGGGRVLFNTLETLSGEDTNSANDLYEWAGGAPLLVSTACAQKPGCSVDFNASAADAAQALFTTTAPLVLGDTDSSADVYEEETGGPPTLVSAGEGACAPCGNNGWNANFDSVSADGTRVTFSSEEPLSSQDTDTTEDIYSRNITTGETILVTPAGYCPIEKSKCKSSFVGASPDDTRVFFTTVERVTPEDGDEEADLWEREIGGENKTRLVSRGNTPGLVLGPQPPVLEGTNPKSPSLSTDPAILGHAEADVTIQLYANGGCTGPAVEGTVAELQSTGIPASVQPGSTTVFAAISIDEQGNPSACSASVSYTAENPLPPPPSPPPPPTEGSGGSGGGGTHAGGGGSSVGSATGSTETKTSRGIVYATPEVQITFGPAFKTRKHRVVFRFADATGQPGTGFFCRIDRKSWHSCGSPQLVTSLRSGRHVFKVKAVNAVGTWGPLPVKRAFKVVGQ